ncbi:helix-turn-helix transcriptional regulator [Nocardioides sp. Soil805]|uniref:helix-turn-helix transcriptional regulator n=1 Tax=Nocardioides sp. Soil805 TaxID=1736416 RepID=UPI0007036E0D|nr:response regulator transcription factor [Nocardioides sp. Soil805]KRF34955.1 DNA-binding protein [Nocardioides sp. Soil805]
MANSDSSSALAALGLDRASEQLYFRVAPASGHTLQGMARLIHETPQGLLHDLAPLMEMGLVELRDDRVVVPPMALAVAALVRREAQRAATSGERLAALAGVVPHLVAATTRPDESDLADVRPLDGELSSGGDPLELIGQMLRTSRGDMLWLRPDAWAMPRESAVSQLLAEAMATGRRSRAIYPIRALSEAPDSLLVRARFGEQVRVISEVPTRMFILGDAHAVLPEPLGFADEPRVHVRQRSVVAALTLWFESLWSRAAPVPELEGRSARPDVRRFLLEQLVAGATDEVIARKLGLSLRTVRRRIATLMSDLGVDTRFQAGVEASRRGWI